MIQLQLKKSDDELFACSKWWGDPDLPPSIKYPTYTDEDGDEYPYTFVCQLRLSDLAPLDAAFPQDGLLLFFAAIDYYLGYPVNPCMGEGLAPEWCTRVIYVPAGEMDTLCHTVLVDDNDEPLSVAARAITFSREASDGGAKLLAPPDLMPWEDWDAPCNGWKPLLQVDSDKDDDFELRFMDEGIFYFLISPHDLKSLDFSHVRGAMVSL